MAKTSLIFLILNLFFLPVKAQEKPFYHASVTKIWETKGVFKTPESVCYDENRQRLYVSNIDGKPGEKDGKGFISVLSLQGQVQDPKWIEGIDAPKGMALSQGHLYVTNIDELLVFDVEDGRKVAAYPHEKARFLNDVAIDNEGRVYVSDMVANKIFRTEEDHLRIWNENEQLQKPNGLLIEKGELLVGMKGALVSLSLSDGSIKELAKVPGSIDGLRSEQQGSYLISDWSGRVYKVTPSTASTTKLIDTTPSGVNAADIEYIPGKKLLLVPTFSNHRVMTYRIGE